MLSLGGTLSVGNGSRRAWATSFPCSTLPLRHSALRGTRGGRRPIFRFFTGRFRDALARGAEALHGVFANYPARFVGAFLRFVIFPVRQALRAAQRCARARSRAACSSHRRRAATGSAPACTCQKPKSEPLGCLEAGPRGDDQGEAVEAKIRAAQKSGTIRGRTPRSSRRLRSPRT